MNLQINMKCGRVKCGKTFVSDKAQKYCHGCAESFLIQQNNLYKANNVKAGKVSLIAEPAANVKGREIPESFMILDHKFCGGCGWKELYDSFGLCIWGMGTFQQCGKCGLVQDFKPDEDD